MLRPDKKCDHLLLRLTLLMHPVLLTVWFQRCIPDLIDLCTDGFETQHDTAATDGTLGHYGHVAHRTLNNAGDDLVLPFGLFVWLSNRRQQIALGASC